MSAVTAWWTRLRPSTGPLPGIALAVALVGGLLVQRDVVLAKRQADYPLLWAAAAALGLAAWWLSDRAASGATGRGVPASHEPAIAAGAIERTGRDRWVAPGLLAGGCLILGTGLVLLWRDIVDPVGAWLWAGGLAAALGGLALGELPAPRRPRWPQTRVELLWLAAGVAVVALGFAMRLYDLAGAPINLDNDEGEHADWSLNLVLGQATWGQHIASPTSPFQTGFQTSPLLGFVVFGGVMRLIGATTVGLRLTPALFGGLGVWLVYIWLRRAVHPAAAIGATALLAVSHLHLFWTRTGFFHSMLLAGLTLAFWLIARPRPSAGYLPWATAGVLIGLTQQLYWGARVALLVVPLFVAIETLRDRSYPRRHARHLLVLALATLAAFGPHGFWYLAEPHVAMARTNGVSIFGDPEGLRRIYPGLDTLGVIRAQVARAVVGIAATGDGSRIFYALRVPLLDPVAGALLLLGAIGLTVRPRAPEMRIAVLWLWSTVLTVCILTIDPPSTSRLVVGLPAAFIVIGGVLDRLLTVWWRASRPAALALAATLSLAVGYAALWNWQVFFVQFPREQPAVAFTVLGELLNRQADDSAKVYVLGPPQLYFFNGTVRFLGRGHVGEDLRDEDLPVRERGWRDGLFVVAAQRAQTLARLRTLYPGGAQAEHSSARGHLFWTYRVPAAQLRDAAGAGAVWRQHDARFGLRGARDGQWLDARSIAADRDGRVYLADRATGRIVVFDADGRSRGTLGGLARPSFGELWAVAAAPDGSLFALDRAARQITHFSRDGADLGQIGGVDSLDRPTDLAVDVDGTLLVVDSGSGRVVRLDPAGFVLESTTIAPRGGQPAHPTTIAVAPDGKIAVGDPAGLIHRLGPDMRPRDVLTMGRIDAELGVHLAFDPRDGALYAVDVAGGQVQRFRSDGQRDYRIGIKSDGPVGLLMPVAVAVDGRGRVFVLDAQRNQVYRFDVDAGRP